MYETTVYFSERVRNIAQHIFIKQIFGATTGFGLQDNRGVPLAIGATPHACATLICLQEHTMATNGTGASAMVEQLTKELRWERGDDSPAADATTVSPGEALGAINAAYDRLTTPCGAWRRAATRHTNSVETYQPPRSNRGTAQRRTSGTNNKWIGRTNPEIVAPYPALSRHTRGMSTDSRLARKRAEELKACPACSESGPLRSGVSRASPYL